MTHNITATWDELLEQSKMTAGDYFSTAVNILKRSELEFTATDAIALAAIMAKDFHTTAMGVAAQNIIAAAKKENDYESVD
jgi:hypothetical protein